jgi:hypothetical protein
MVIPPPAAGQIGVMLSIGSRQADEIAEHASGLKEKRPPKFGKIDTSAPASRINVPNRTLWEIPPVGEETNPPSRAG